MNRIARDGHVYAFIPTIENLNKNAGKLDPVLVGVHSASTFTGFCSVHDDAIFAPVEKLSFTASAEQCFLLGYRAMARERYTKESSVRMSSIRRLADRGKGVDRQIEVQMLNQLFEYGLAAGVEDTIAQMEGYSSRLMTGDYGDVRAYVIETVDPPPVMCSAGWLPSSDFDGNELQDIAAPKRLAAMTVTSMWGGTKGAIVFQWFAQDDDVCRRFIGSLDRVDSAGIGAALVRLMFEHFENVHISPDWWEGLPELTKSSLIHRMARSANMFARQLDKPLIDDGLALPEWKIEGRFTIGYTREG
ncbi:hypothetical protein [Mesorhizobium sp. 1M-11]|uniref:hypothetical protein n=1 Tax=Mesorhizobium sp. 1M-11 TaxID=1529006 RepID=UPI0006C74E54|nr:hypothetical protein [Mesorhizobium sp. 1M-11]